MFSQTRYSRVNVQTTDLGAGCRAEGSLPVEMAEMCIRDSYPAYIFNREYLDIPPGGLPHSEIPGSSAC